MRLEYREVFYQPATMLSLAHSVVTKSEAKQLGKHHHVMEH